MLRAVLCGSLVVALAAACSSPDQQEPTPDPSPRQSESAESLVFRDFAGLPFGELIAQFDDQGAQVSVDIATDDPSSSVRLTFGEFVASGAAVPDVVTLSASDFEVAQAAGLLTEWRLLTIEPAAICYREDLIEAAGIAQSREEFAEVLGQGEGGWEQYFAVGRAYQAATGRAWFGEASHIWDAMVGQLPEGITVPGRMPSAATDSELLLRWTLLTTALSENQSAGEALWDWDAGAALLDDSFATMPCSPGIREVIGAYIAAAGATTGGARWNVVDYFPGGPASMGEVYVGVTTNGAESEAAMALVTWLAGTDAQAQFPGAGIGMPADPAAQSTWMDRDADQFLAQPGAGAIDVARAAGLDLQVVGPGDSALNLEVAGPLLEAVRTQSSSPDQAWQDLLRAVAP